MKIEFQNARKLQKSPFIPLFQRGKITILDPLQIKNVSSLWKREVGRDFWEGFSNHEIVTKNLLPDGHRQTKALDDCLSFLDRGGVRRLHVVT